MPKPRPAAGRQERRRVFAHALPMTLRGRARWRLLVERFACGASQTSGQARSPPRPAPPRTSHACARRPDAQAPTLHALTVDQTRIDPTYDFNQTAPLDTLHTQIVHIVNAHAHVKLR